MTLLTDIESAAARAAATVPLAGEVDPDIACHDFVGTEYWPRIKAALGAAQEMDVDLCHVNHKPTFLPTITTSQQKFREAMGE